MLGSVIATKLARNHLIVATRFFLLCALAQASAVAQSPAPPAAPVDTLIPWLLQEDSALRGIPFSEVIFDATGKRVLAFNAADETDARVAKQISSVLDEVLRRMNAADSLIQHIERINEVSSHFEDLLRELLNASPDLACDFPRTDGNHIQRSGYPDLCLVDKITSRVYYLDPKLYAAGSRASSFRSFYFEPKSTTNKVRHDAVHFIVGIEHGPAADQRWHFDRWDLVDLSKFKVRLKAEFQGSNADMYRTDAIVASSVK